MRLSKQGDPHEKRYWDSFIAECFPSYEAFWRAHVAPLTRRSIDPDDIGFLSREDLAKRADEDIAVAQLHSTLRDALTHHGLWIAPLRGEMKQPELCRGPETIARVAAAGKARVAKMYPVFNPAGTPAKKKARICALTFICSKGDPHPTDAGYRAMAAAFLAASGYARRS